MSAEVAQPSIDTLPKPDRQLALDESLAAFYDAYLNEMFKQGVGTKEETFNDLPAYQKKAYASALFYAFDFLTIDVDRRDLAVYEVLQQLREKRKHL